MEDRQSLRNVFAIAVLGSPLALLASVRDISKSPSCLEELLVVRTHRLFISEVLRAVSRLEL